MGSHQSHAQRDEARLAQLWAEPAGDRTTEDYPFGPGAVLNISVSLFDLRQLVQPLRNTGITCRVEKSERPNFLRMSPY